MARRAEPPAVYTFQIRQLQKLVPIVKADFRVSPEEWQTVAANIAAITEILARATSRGFVTKKPANA